MNRLLKRFARNENGLAMIEFLIIFPFMFLLVFGAVELTRYIVIAQKVAKASYVLTDAVGQFSPSTTTGGSNQINQDRLNNIADGYQSMMWPFGNPQRQAIIFTSVVRQNGQSRVRWQYYRPGAQGVTSITGFGPTTQTRSSSGPCPNAPFNSTINTELATMPNGENMIVGEVFYQYRPVLRAMLEGISGSNGGTPWFIDNTLLSRRLFLHPRAGDLLGLPPGSQNVSQTDGGACT